jgi:hypothetical protein
VSNVKKVPDPPAGGWPDCMCCSDTGLIGGDKHGHEYRFCLCPAGARRRDSEPAATDEANVVWDKLRRL